MARKGTGKHGQGTRELPPSTQHGHGRKKPGGQGVGPNVRPRPPSLDRRAARNMLKVVARPFRTCLGNRGT